MRLESIRTMGWAGCFGLRQRLRLPEIALSLVLLTICGLSGCSLRQVAVDYLGDSLSDDASVFASEEDPDLIREAIPFGLKTYESLLAVSPTHRGLLLAATRGFTVYAYLLQDEADRVDAEDLTRARLLRARAKKLYLRGRDYALRGLDIDHPRFSVNFREDPARALASSKREVVDFLYWAGLSWAGALSVGKDDLNLVSELPLCGALVERVIELNDTYERGAAHEFFISYEGNRPGGSADLARRHFHRAVELSSGRRASVYLALAETVSVRDQNLGEFTALLAAALRVEPNEQPELRLANVIARRRAQWLQTQIPHLFLEAGEPEVAK
jgi:hypothetical protein